MDRGEWTQHHSFYSGFFSSADKAVLKMDTFCLACVIALVAVGSATDTWKPHYISCDGFPDGYHEVGCWGKAVCVNGEPVVTECASDQMFDFDSDTCISRSQHVSSTACNQVMDCSKQPSGRYADVGDGCRSYFICMQGAFFGRMYCPPTTIFNEALQVCDYPGDAPAPCGSHVGSYSSTPNGPYPDISA